MPWGVLAHLAARAELFPTTGELIAGQWFKRWETEDRKRRNRRRYERRYHRIGMRRKR